MTAARQMIGIMLLGLGASAAGLAHPIVIHPGAVEWSGRNLRITLDVELHNLSHEVLALGHGVAIDYVPRALAECIVVLTPQGEQVAAALVEVSDDGRRAVSEYTLPAGVSAAVLLQRGDDRLASLGRQFQLSWRPAGAEKTHLVRLTSGGNHVVLLRDDDLDSDIADIDRFAEPVVYIARCDGEGFEAWIDYPCTLLATWPGLVEVYGCTFTRDFFSAIRHDAAAWASERLALEGAEWSGVSAFDVDLISQAGDADSGESPKRFSIYTTRVRLHVRAECEDKKVELTWRGFNGAVMRAPVVDLRGERSKLAGMLNPTQATLTISPEASSRVAIHRASGERGAL